MTGFIREDIFLEEEDTMRGRFLTFTVENSIYGLSVRFVTEIIPDQKATMVPETPDYVRGIINLHGRIIPLIDMRLKFGRVENTRRDRNCIVVIDVNSISVGLIVDKVNDVITLGDSQIAAPPTDGALGFENRYIEGIGKYDSSVVLLLDAEKLLRTEEMDIMESLTDSNA